MASVEITGPVRHLRRVAKLLGVGVSTRCTPVADYERVMVPVAEGAPVLSANMLADGSVMAEVREGDSFRWRRFASLEAFLAICRGWTAEGAEATMAGNSAERCRREMVEIIHNRSTRYSLNPTPRTLGRSREQMTDPRYLSRDEIAAYIGQTVTIRRHLAPGVDRLSLLVGELLYVGTRGERGGLPGRMRTDRGETAVDLDTVLDVRPAAEATVRDLERRLAGASHA